MSYEESQHSYLQIEMDQSNMTAVNYAIYASCSLLGVVGNVLLMLAIVLRLGYFGDRRTFTALIMLLCVLDLLLSLCIPLELLLMTHVTYLHVYDYFMHPRNFILISESVTFFYISVDRFLAIFRPTNEFWTVGLIVKSMSVLLGLALLVDVGFLATLHVTVDNFVVYYGIQALCTILTVEFCVTMALTMLTYVALFVVYYRHTQAVEENILRRVQQSHPAQAAAHSQSLQKLHTAVQPEPVTGTTAAGTAGTAGGEEDPQTTADNACVRTRWSFRRRQYMRLVKMLILVTSVYAFSMIPHFLGAWEIVTDMNFLLYYAFYINCVANPLISLTTDKKLREDLYKWMKRTLHGR